MPTKDRIVVYKMDSDGIECNVLMFTGRNLTMACSSPEEQTGGSPAGSSLFSPMT